MQGWFDIPKSINVIPYINRLKKKNHFISIDAEKQAFDKIQHSCMTKTINKLGIEENFLSLIENILNKPTANIILNGKKIKAFRLRSPSAFNTIPVAPTKATTTRKGNKSYADKKRRNKTVFVHR